MASPLSDEELAEKAYKWLKDDIAIHGGTGRRLSKFKLQFYEHSNLFKALRLLVDSKRVKVKRFDEFNFVYLELTDG